MDFAEPCPLVRPGLPLFGFCSSGRSFASALLSDGASRRPPLRLASPLSHRTWAEDLHLPAIKHARHTRSRGRTERAHRSLETTERFPQLPQGTPPSLVSSAPLIKWYRATPLFGAFGDPGGDPGAGVAPARRDSKCEPLRAQNQNRNRRNVLHIPTGIRP